MATEERARAVLIERLDEVMGREVTDTLMGYLPPVGWADVATRHDLSNVEERLALRIDRLGDRMVRIEQRLDGHDDRFEALEGRLSAVEGRLTAVEGRLSAVEGRLTAVEGRLDAVEGRLDAVESRLTAVEDRLAELASQFPLFEARLERGLRSWMFAMIAMMATTVGAAVALSHVV